MIGLIILGRAGRTPLPQTITLHRAGSGPVYVLGPFDLPVTVGRPTVLSIMSNPEATSPTPNADAIAIATLLLSRGKYFIGSKFDTTITPDEGDGPYVCTYAGVVRDRTPDNLYFLVDIYGSAFEFTTGEDVVLGQRLMSLEQLARATFYPDFATMQAIAADHSGFIDSLNID
jgi:hypothetical protein